MHGADGLIRRHLDELLEHELFAQAERQRRFLRFIVEEELGGRSARINQTVIAFEVFDRDADYDPLQDSIVRVEARRLRSKLTEYYAAHPSAPVVVSMPKGGYRASLERADPDLGPGAAAAVDGSGGPPVIAVLPFDNFSDDAAQDYFSDGIAEQIITDLVKISGLRVISRHSTFVYRGRPVSARQVGKELGARYILEGSVRRAGDRLRITAQLIDAQLDDHLWAERYDRAVGDVFAIQDDVSRQIVAALRLRLSDEEQQRLGHHGTESPEAHDLYLRAAERFYRFTQGSLGEAASLFERSLEIDPLFADAHAWLSRVRLMALISGVDPSREQTLLPALRSARRAIELDPLLPLGHASLGWALMWDRQIDEALEAARRAVELGPNFADAWLWHALVHASAGLGEPALRSAERAVALNPHYSATYLMALGTAHLALGELEQARRCFARGCERQPDFVFNHLMRAAVCGLLERVEEAEQARVMVERHARHRRLVRESFFFNDPQLRRLFRAGLERAGLETAERLSGPD